MIENWVKVSDELPLIEEGKCSSNRLICKMAGSHKLPEYKLMVLKKKNKSYYDETSKDYEFMALERLAKYELSEIDSWAYIEPQDTALDICDNNNMALIKLNNLDDIDYLKSNFQLCLNFTKNFITELMNLENSHEIIYKNFNSNGNIKKAIFEDGIEIIPEYLLSSTGLEYLELPSTLKCIQDSAFDDCNKLASVNLPEGLEYLGSAAFSNTIITEIKLPKSLKRIGFSAFSDCKKLKKVDLSDYKLNYISTGCFDSCSSLEYIDIPESVISINENAFNYCSSLEGLNLPSSLKYIYSDALRSTNIKHLDLPKNLKLLGNRAFSSCILLKEVKIPSSIEFIGECCFSYCNLLEKVHIDKGAKDTVIDTHICDSCNNLKEIICGKELYENLSKYSELEEFIKVE